MDRSLIQIKQWRRARELSQVKLADLVGVTGASVSRWENGVVPAGVDDLQKLAEALGIPPHALWLHPDEWRALGQSVEAASAISGVAPDDRDAVLDLVRRLASRHRN